MNSDMRLPLELRNGIVPHVASWFVLCNGQPGDAVEPRNEAVVRNAAWTTFVAHVQGTAARTPYSAIGDYMDRWWYLPEIFGERARVHRTLRSDHGRDRHDHPWHFVSLILEGGYTEELDIPGTDGDLTDRRRYRPGDLLFRHAEHRHRLELEEGTPCLSLVFTSQNVRDWGFWTPSGFVHWELYNHLEPAAA